MKDQSIQEDAIPEEDLKNIREIRSICNKGRHAEVKMRRDGKLAVYEVSKKLKD